GVKTGDILIAVNGEKIDLKNIRPTIGQSMQWEEDSPLVFEVMRNGETLKLEGKVMKGTTEVEELVIEELLESDPKKILRTAWLKAL
ncbi:MAG: C-terminal processing protease CtpA/Prc, partial [Polaribacter sp.]